MRTLAEQEGPLTAKEVAAWREALSPTIQGKINVIKNLLKFAGEDHITAEDREICETTLKELESDLATL